MPNTTNFNFPTPADTDLVKDGASAIRSLGNSIDTAFVDLKGGTTGQILSKASNTDLDYTWIANDQGDITNVEVTSPITGGGSSGSVTIGIQDGTTAQKGAVQLENSTSSTSTTTAAVPASVKSAYDLANAAIPKSLVDAAGDLIYATANDTVARLALGTAGKVLTVNSGATAPEWATPASSGGITLIATSTPSAVSAINYTSIAGTYKHLLLTWNGVYTSDHSTAFNVRFNNDSSGIYSVNGLSDKTFAGGEYALFMEGNSTGANSGHGYLYIYDYASSAYWKTFNGQSAYYDGDFGWKGANDARGMWRSTSAITSIDIVRTSGSGTLTVDTGGVVKLWGLS